METGIIKANLNTKTQVMAESELNTTSDHMIGYILRNMYNESGKNYSYEEIKNILEHKNKFQNKYFQK